MPPAGFSGILKLIHILFATVWVGGNVLLLVLGVRALKTDAATRIHFAEEALPATRAFAVAALVALASGVWLVIREDAWGFDQAWISIGFTGMLLGFILGPAFYAPQTRAFIAEEETGDSAAGSRNRRIGRVAAVETIVLLVVVWAMIYKPGL